MLIGWGADAGGGVERPALTKAIGRRGGPGVIPDGRAGTVCLKLTLHGQ